ncbi:MAG: hypothetical protein PHF56_02435 [Desulfuromonadaceae bacterium]|nr:hypothetical protein [Desulfuromonadaceae bacterium]
MDMKRLTDAAIKPLAGQVAVVTGAQAAQPVSVLSLPAALQ